MNFDTTLFVIIIGFPFPQMADLIKVCLDHGANVAEIREPDANAEILRIRQLPNVKTFVIGSGNDEANEGTWVWASDGNLFFDQRITLPTLPVLLSGEKIPALPSGEQIPGMAYHNFGSNWPTTNTDDNCLVMVSGSGTWQSKPCDTGKKVLCEADAVSGMTLFPGAETEWKFID